MRASTRHNHCLISEPNGYAGREASRTIAASGNVANDVMANDVVVKGFVPASVLGAANVANATALGNAGGIVTINGQDYVADADATVAEFLAFANALPTVDAVLQIGKVKLTATGLNDLTIAAGNVGGIAILAALGIAAGATPAAVADTYVLPTPGIPQGVLDTAAVALTNPEHDRRFTRIERGPAEVKEVVVGWPVDPGLNVAVRAALAKKGIVARF